MAKIAYWLVTGGVYGALAHGLDLRGELGAGLVCWVVAWVSWAVAAAFFALGVRRD